MKWAATQPTRGNYDFTKADKLVAFADANDMAVRGHTLLWDQETIDLIDDLAMNIDQINPKP